ncbi:MAG: sigma-54-dependent Fis family transcriptional regulator [Myxococcaceae bacterium]|nr:sigma-54-dependent Fis family transcriptional regulator [Myxococcaceae bacterium]
MLRSQLRLQLVAELLSEPQGLTLEQAAVRTACPEGDVLACLKPLSELRVLEEEDQGRRWKLGQSLPAELLDVMRAAVRRGAGHLKRQRHVRRELLRGMIGSDPKMQLVTEMVRKVARLDVPVLITGETGTGKELVARAIHELSTRSGAFFGDVNCATLAEPLFESHVFGHTRGAFTGAIKSTEGLVERADGGTLFLDEIGELGLAAQAKLLKVLQSHRFTRVGETTERTSSFRLVSATNRHLPDMVARGLFREDLFYRINVFPISLPALRERLGDVPQLVEELARRADFAGGDAPVATPAALEALARHTWPGNIRELDNVVTRALIASGGGTIEAGHLPWGERAPTAPKVAATAPRAELRSLARAERDHVVEVLTALGGNISDAARTLEVSRTTLYRMLRRHGIRFTKTLQP